MDLPLRHNNTPAASLCQCPSSPTVNLSASMELEDSPWILFSVLNPLSGLTAVRLYRYI